MSLEGNGCTVRETDTMESVAAFADPGYGNLEISKDGQHLAGFTRAQVTKPWPGEVYPLQIYDVRTGRKQVLVQAGNPSLSDDIAFAPDSTMIAAADDVDWSIQPRKHAVGIWDVGTGQRIRGLDGHTSVVHPVDWSPDGKVIAAAADDGMIRIWDVKTGSALGCLELKNLHADSRIGFASDSRTLLIWRDRRELFAWDTASGDIKPLGELPGNNVKFFRDGHGCDYVLLSYHDQWLHPVQEKYREWIPDGLKLQPVTMWLWKQVTVRQLYRFDHMTGELTKVMKVPSLGKVLAISPDGKSLLAWQWEPKQEDWKLVWWSLEGSMIPSVTAFAWAGGISGVYWLWRAWRLWRRRARSLASTS